MQQLKITWNVSADKVLEAIQKNGLKSLYLENIAEITLADTTIPYRLWLSVYDYGVQDDYILTLTIDYRMSGGYWENINFDTIDNVGTLEALTKNILKSSKNLLQAYLN